MTPCNIGICFLRTMITLILKRIYFISLVWVVRNANIWGVGGQEHDFLKKSGLGLGVDMELENRKVVGLVYQHFWSIN